MNVLAHNYLRPRKWGYALWCVFYTTVVVQVGVESLVMVTPLWCTVHTAKAEGLVRFQRGVTLRKPQVKRLE